VSLRRLRGGEWLALAGAATLFVALFGDWFGLDPDAFQGALPRAVAEAVAKDGWTSLGWLLVAMLVVSIGLAVWLAVATVTGPAAQAIAAAVLATTVGTITAIALLIRVLTQPGLGVDAPNGLIDVRAGAYVGLAAMFALAAGAWWSLRDERTGAAESGYEPPTARPAPPATL
jgi:hypothetical protein